MLVARLSSRARPTSVLLGVFLLLSFIGADCAQTHTVKPEAQAQWTRDSIDYERHLAKWIYDSTAIDSVERSINIDSLAAMYQRMLKSDSPAAELQIASCEESRIARRYGSVPAIHVIRRVRDSIYAAAGPGAVAQAEARMPRSGRITSSACPKPEGPVVTQTPGGTPLNVNLYRPRAPRRP